MTKHVSKVVRVRASSAHRTASVKAHRERGGGGGGNLPILTTFVMVVAYAVIEGR